MSRTFARLATLAVALGGIAFAGARTEPSPQQRFGALYAAVESAALFSDSKTFADAVPREAPQRILRAYRTQQPRSAEALRAFVEREFEIPTPATTLPAPPVHPAPPLLDHIDALWSQLERHTARVPAYSSQLPLPRSYVVPGGRFRELYYWDSYFTLLGIAQSGRRDLLGDMVADFAWLIGTYGHVPNGTRSYYLGRSQPPFFFEMVALLEPTDPPAAWAQYLPQLKREYAFWMAGAQALHAPGAHRRVVRLGDGTVLNRYWDDVDAPRDESWREDVNLARTSGREPHELYRDIRAAAESGWDFSSRWLGDPAALGSIQTTQILPVDLNSLLFGLERAIAAGCRRTGDASCGRDFARRAAARRRGIDRYLWDARRGVYLDYRWTVRARTSIESAATLYPLFEHLSTAAQAAAVAATVRRELLVRGGLATTEIRTGQQWDAPNGWAPLQWIGIRGLRDVHEVALASAIACRWLVTVTSAYREDGKLVEKYDVLTSGRGAGGEYPLQDGFGWTNGVTRRLLADYPDFSTYTRLEQCPDPGDGA